jgi:hypothetical protein
MSKYVFTQFLRWHILLLEARPQSVQLFFAGRLATFRLSVDGGLRRLSFRTSCCCFNVARVWLGFGDFGFF